MEGPTSSGGSRNRLTCLTLQEYDDDMNNSQKTLSGKIISGKEIRNRQHFQHILYAEQSNTSFLMENHKAPHPL